MVILRDFFAVRDINAYIIPIPITTLIKEQCYYFTNTTRDNKWTTVENVSNAKTHKISMRYY